MQPVVEPSISKRVSSEQHTAGDQLTYALIAANSVSTPERPVSTAKEVLVSDPGLPTHRWSVEASVISRGSTRPWPRPPTRSRARRWA